MLSNHDKRNQLLSLKWFNVSDVLKERYIWFGIPLLTILICIIPGFISNNMCAAGLSAGDPNSYSKPDEAVIKKIHLSLNVDFKRKVLAGKSNLTIEKIKENRVILDIKDLTIQSVIDVNSGNALNYSIEEPIHTFGSRMEIVLPKDDGKIYVISISYETSPTASGLQWLEPEQTAGRRHPYLFSQCEAIHCRSLMPCQDTPSVKMTYTADISAPSELVVLMSAKRLCNLSVQEDGTTVHSFKQDVPIPSYLLAIAVGHLESRKIGPRSHVWSEKEIIDKAEYEFGETEQMLSTAEEICGPYVWGIYDLLVLPPSFPFGGMENPCLTFITPTLLAGDRSLSDVVAHEISHSWTGNLVTNRNFEHFWLNEGFTMFVERKILEKMNGNASRHFSAIGGLKDLADTIKSRGVDDPLTCLVPDLKGIDPDDSFSTVPYEKGHTFLFYLEELLGGPDVFNPFLKAYLKEFKFKSIDTDDFKSFLYKYFQNSEKLQQVNWEEWLYRPGMPPIIPKYDTSLADMCTALAQKWINWIEEIPSTFTAKDLSPLSSSQVKEFLAQLLESEPLTITKLQTMQEVYDFNSVTNCEIRFRWIRLCIKGKWTAQVDRALDFVTEQGRMKYVRPIYRDLYAWPEVREKAIETFNRNKPNMMYVSAYTVAKDLHI